jgi:hypothetical protein
MLSVNFFCNISAYDICAYITKNYIALIYYAKIVYLLCQFHAGKVVFYFIKGFKNIKIFEVWGLINNNNKYQKTVTWIIDDYDRLTDWIRPLARMFSVNVFCNISAYDIFAYITKNYIALIYYAKIVHLLCQFHAGKVVFMDLCRIN